MKTKNLLQTIFNFVLAFGILAFAGVPHIASVAVAALTAYSLALVPSIGKAFSGFITNGSDWNGKEMEDIILRPIFIGQLPTEMGIKVILSVKSKLKLTFFGPVSKILKAYSDGFQGSSATTKVQKELILAEFKAEADYSKQDYKNTVLENLSLGGLNQNEVASAILNKEVELFMNGVKEDVRRIFWLGDTTKLTLSSGVYTATADTDYNVINGIWKALFDSAVAYGSATANDVRRITISNGAVAQVTTHTLTGTSGTANITISGVTYLATFTTSLTVSAANFVTSHAAALLARGIVVTSSTADVILTASIAGAPFTSTAAAVNVSGNLAGTVAQTTANTAPSDLTTDEAKATFKSMYENSSKVLKGLYAKKMVRFYATDTMIENYMATLEGTGTEMANRALVDGVERLAFRGIPILPMDIDGHLAADFVNARPHRAILTLPENLVLVLNGQTDIAATKFWFNPDENQNRQRTQFDFGADFVEPQYITVAY